MRAFDKFIECKEKQADGVCYGLDCEECNLHIDLNLYIGFTELI